MRKLIFILIALVSFSQAQTIQYIGAPTTTVISRGNFRTDSIFYLPKRTKTPTDTAAFRYQISDSSLYYWTGYQWTKVQSASSFASVDTTVISTRAYRQKGIDSVQYNVGLKFNITDTSNMLSPYFRKVDTLTLSNRINLKLNISDTSTMLSPYARTSNVNASLATKVNISDTSTMLSPYLRKSDTLTLSNRINLKVNISDTASMLTPYLRKFDTTAMLSPYYRSATATAALATKLNISDTSSMLSPYLIGSGTSNYFPKFNATRSVVNSKLYESNLNLLFNSTTPYITTSGISTIENNGTSASVYVLKTLDTARAYVSFGGANTMDINNLRAGDIRFYTNATLRGRFQTDGTFRLNSLTGTGSRIVVADANGVLSAGSSATDLIDTTYISSRAWRQKGVDSVQFNVGLKVNISDTSTMLSPYIRHAGYGLTKSSQALSVDTALMATRLRVGKVVDSLGLVIATKGSGTVTSVATGYGLSGGTITTTGTLIADTALIASRLRLGKVADSLSLVKQNVLTNPVTGTGTTNYVPKFTGTSSIGNSQIFDNGTTVGLGITPSAWVSWRALQNGAFSMANISNVGFLMANAFWDGAYKYINTGAAQVLEINNANEFRFLTASSGTAGNPISFTQAMTLNTGGELLINTTTDAGAYTLQNNGALYNTGSAILAATSGGVTMGSTAAPLSELDIYGTTSLAFTGFRAQQLIYSTEAFNANPNASIGFVNKFTSAGGYGTLGSISVGKENATDGNAAGYMSFYTYGPSALTEKMRITSGGSVGIGTASPASKADIVGTLRISTASFSQPTSGAGIELSFRSSDSTGYLATYSRDYSAYRNQAYFSLSHRFYSGTGGSDALFITSSSESLFGTTTDAGNYRVQVSGNAYVTGTSVLAATNGEVLIRGTNNPLADVNRGNITLNGTLSNIIAFTNGSSATGYLFQSTTDMQLYNATATGNLRFFTNGTEYMRITPSGNIGMGTQSPNSSSILDLSSTTQGFLPPRMTTTQRDAISSPAAGLVIYNTTTSKLQVYTTSWTDLH